MKYRGQKIEERAIANAWGNVGPVDVAAPVAPPLAAPLTALLTGHVLQNGELILLVLKPSMLFIVLSMLRFTAGILILVIASILLDDYLPGRSRAYVEVGMSILAIRLMWATLVWVGRLYILTDLRVIRLSGVFYLEILDCPLRKIARTRILKTMRERLCRLGTIEIIPSDEDYPIATWQMVAQPRQVNEQIVSAINQAKQGGRMCGAA